MKVGRQDMTEKLRIGRYNTIKKKLTITNKCEEQEEIKEKDNLANKVYYANKKILS